MTFCLVFTALASPVFVWALARARQEAGGVGSSPFLLAAVNLVLWYVPLGNFVMSSSKALVDVDGRADEPVPWFIAWAGPLLVVPATALIVAMDVKPPLGLYLSTVVVVVYGMSRIFIARRVHRICSNLLLRPAVDSLRASHAAPVGGG